MAQVFSRAAAARTAAQAGARAPAAASLPLPLAELLDADGYAASQFDRFCDTFAPSLRRSPLAYRGYVYVQRADLPDDAPKWTKATAQNRLDLRRALAAHVLAGATGEPQSYVDGGAEVNAIGLACPPGEIVRVLNVDLDEHETAVRLLDALGPVVGASLLVTSSSGDPKPDGRTAHRALVPIAPMRYEHVQRIGAALLDRLGFPLGLGRVELYPSARNGRVPFGRGGCRQFDPSLHPRLYVQRHPLALSEQLHALPPVDLQAALAALGGTVVSLPVAEPEQSPQPEPEPQRGRARALRRLRDCAQSVEAADLWRCGVDGPGQRDGALYALTVDCMRRGRSEAEAVAAVRAWIAAGKLDGSEAVARHGRERQLRDVPRRVRAVYATHPQPVRPKPVHLSAREIAAVVQLAEATARRSGFDAAALGTLLFAVLPVFKACELVRRRARRPDGFSDVRMHSDEWRAAGGPSYRAMRDALGVFTRTRRHLAASSLRARGLAPDKATALAHAAHWTVAFPFDLDETAPRRPLGRTYARARLAAELQLQREARRAAGTRAAEQARVRVNGSESQAKGSPHGRHKDVPPLCDRAARQGPADTSPSAGVLPLQGALAPRRRSPAGALPSAAPVDAGPLVVPAARAPSRGFYDPV